MLEIKKGTKRASMDIKPISISNNELTIPQEELYDILVEFYHKNFKSPTITELIKKTGKARSTIWDLLKKIEKKGYIKVEKRKTRGIRLILEEEKYDECIYFCENDIKKEKNVKCRPSKSNKQSRGTIWS